MVTRERPVIDPAGLPAVGVAAVPALVDDWPADPPEILAPADGRVMHAGAPQAGVAPEGDWLQVAIFLSAFDVHINRSPAAGVVRDVTYHPGRWLAAFSAASAVENERSEIHMTSVVEGVARPLVYRQVVGLLARRIVTRVRPGQTVLAGERIGLMKFGSRMDVFVPTDCTLEVSRGDRVVAGETVIARWS